MTVGLTEVSLSHIAEMFRGVTEVERFVDGIAPLRLPAWTRTQQANDWVQLWAAHTLGVRLVTRTTASRIRLLVTATRMSPAPAEDPLFSSIFVATVDGVEADRAAITEGPRIVTLPGRIRLDEPGPSTTVELDLGSSETPRDVVVWFPHSAAVVVHEVHADAQLFVAPPATRPRWLHHGSSISHSLEAPTPRETWPQLAATELGLELTNLAIAGNAQLDPFLARTLATVPADVVTLKLGVNLINADSMRERTFVPALHGFLDLVREGHPGVPIVVITSVVCPSIEDTPGPTVKEADGLWYGSPREIAPGDGTLTLSLTRMLIREAVAKRQATDPHLYLGEGLELFGKDDVDLLWDGLHPSAPGYELIASRFAALARDPESGIGAGFSGVL